MSLLEHFTSCVRGFPCGARAGRAGASSHPGRLHHWLALAELLPQRRPLTVIINSQLVLNTLNDQEGIALIFSTGGQYYQWCDDYMGKLTIDALENMRASSCPLRPSSTASASTSIMRRYWSRGRFRHRHRRLGHQRGHHIDWTRDVGVELVVAQIGRRH